MKSQWNKCRKAVNTSFNTKTKMRVSAYNEFGEKVVEMTPRTPSNIIYSRLVPQSRSALPAISHGLEVSDTTSLYDHVNSNRPSGIDFQTIYIFPAIIENIMSPCIGTRRKNMYLQAHYPNFNLSRLGCPATRMIEIFGPFFTLRSKPSKKRFSFCI
ncbi:MAG: hypothetical protein IPP49_12155 [Saprospiraceae bacterium]|nr:hypothetical protein [Saprospiraceae bacterium]